MFKLAASRLGLVMVSCAGLAYFCLLILDWRLVASGILLTGPLAVAGSGLLITSWAMKSPAVPVRARIAPRYTSRY